MIRSKGVQVKKVEILTLPNGKKPFSEWLKRQTFKIQADITKYIERLEKGGAKNNIKNVGEGVCELKIDKGPGYRVYFCEIENVIILLLLGGKKSSQSRDIEKAKKYRRSIYV